MISRTVYIVSLVVVAAGAAGIDRVLTARAEVECPVSAPAAPPEVVTPPPIPHASLPAWHPLPATGNPRY